MDEHEPPRPTGKPPRQICLTGSLLAFGPDDQPIFVRMFGSEDLFLPIFSTNERLVSMLEKLGVPWAKISSIDDEDVFLSSLPILLSETILLRVIVDPHFEGKKILFTEVVRPGMAEA